MTTTIDPLDPTTWTLEEDTLPNGRRVVTSWHPTRFSPGWGLAGEPLHYQTAIIAGGRFGASWEYACESEARLGHARVLADLSQQRVTA
jgi:hypothetical protein